MKNFIIKILLFMCLMMALECCKKECEDETTLKQYQIELADINKKQDDLTNQANAEKNQAALMAILGNLSSVNQSAISCQAKIDALKKNSKCL